jgi:hypothetical protein
MAKLPRTRPGRQTARRKQSRARPAAARRPRKPAGAPPARDPHAFGPREPAPGLPRLALDGAIEAAKMPLKVGANVTSRAIRALKN